MLVTKQGKTTEYTLNEDGSILINEEYSKLFEEERIKKIAVEDAMEIALQVSAGLLEERIRTGKKLWEKIFEDYGLDKARDYSYTPATKSIYVKKEL